LAVLKLAVLVSGVLALAKLGFLDFITGGFDTGRFGGLPKNRRKVEIFSTFWTACPVFTKFLTFVPFVHGEKTGG
jgi:hypothetical protein